MANGKVAKLERMVARLEAQLDIVWRLGCDEYNFDFMIYDVEPTEEEITKKLDEMKRNGDL